jgi:hypothetical protein
VKLLEDPSWSPGKSGKAWVDVSSAGVGQREPITAGEAIDGNEAAVRDLLAAVRERRQPLMNAHEARATVEMISACYESARTATRAPLPLALRNNPLERFES